MEIKPRRVKVDGNWCDVSSGWSGSLELRAWMSPTSYTARIAFAHINNLYYVYDSSGSHIGEFNTEQRTYSGRVTGVEV